MPTPRRSDHRSSQYKTQSRSFRKALRLELLEQRNLMTVSSQLSGGVLGIDFDADKDSAEVSIVGNQLQVVSDSGSVSFNIGDIQSIDVESLGGTDQQIKFRSNLSIRNALTVAGIGQVIFTTGNYQVGSASIVASGAIEFESFVLGATGNVLIESSQTLTETESGLLGFLGVVAEAENSITISNSTITGATIDVLARTEISATADGDDDEDESRDFARVKISGNAAIFIVGNSVLQSNSSLSLLAESMQSVDATAIAHPEDGSTSRDAGLALTNVFSSATVELTDATRLQAVGGATVKAHNVVTITTTADGALAGGGGKGAMVALAEFTGVTNVLLTDDVQIIAATIDIDAQSLATLTTTAKSTVGGATANDATTQADLQDNNAQTSSGGLGLAGAYARTKSDRTTQVTISGASTLRATGAVDIVSDESGTTTTTADSGATNNGGEEGNGVGVSIAIDRALSANRVLLDGRVTVAGTQLNASAISPNGNSHATKAISGVGAAELGFAGSFVRTQVETTTESLLADSATLVAGGAAVSFTAESRPTITSDAEPSGAVGLSARKGLGASVANSKLNNTTTAKIGKSAVLIGAAELKLLASANDTVITKAVTGADGGTAITPGVATAVVDSNVRASLDTGDSTTITGAVELQSNQAGDIATSVAGDILGEKAALGGSFALNDVDIGSTASISRSITAAGDVTANSTADGSIRVESKASSKGTGESESDSDEQTALEQQAAGSDKVAPSADAKGKVSAGAATAINLVDVHAQSVVDERSIVQSTGVVSLASSNSIDVSAKADGSAVGTGTTSEGTTTGGTDRGVGIAVAINRVDSSSLAQIERGVTVAADGGVSLNAGSTVGEDTQREFSAESISGGGGRKTGFAGSFALNRVDNQSEAIISNEASIDVGDQSLTVISTNSASNSAKATPATSATGEQRGIGASFALNIAENKVAAQVQPSVTISSEQDGDANRRSTITAISNQTAVTEAKGGSGSEESPGTKALTPVFAIQAVNNQTDATHDAQTTALAGSLEVLANLTATNTLSAEGTAVAENAARGLVLALDLGSNLTSADVGGNISGGTSLNVNSKADVTQSVISTASSKGGDINPSAGGTDKETADAKKLAIDAGAKDNSEISPEQKTPEGSVAFAAAIAVGLTRTTTTARIAQAAQINSADAVSVDAQTRISSIVKADAAALTVAAAESEESSEGDTEEDESTSDASGRGVGVAIAVHVNSATTEAIVDNGTSIKSEGLAVRASTLSDETNSFTTEAISGAGGGKVGTAGSLAIAVIRNAIDARIQTAAIDAGSGQLEVLATNNSTSDTDAKPSSNASGSQRGRGASVAISSTRNTTTAEVEDGALIRKAGSLVDPGATNINVNAISNNTATTDALGGAGSESEVGEKAPTGVFSLARVVNTTKARLSSSDVGRSRVSGNINVEATHNGSTTTNAEGSARAERTSVGIVLGLGVANDDTTAEIDNLWSAEGGVSVKANNDAQSVTNSKASARGGEADKKNSDEEGGADVKVSESTTNLADADGQAIDEEIPDAKTPDGSLALAGSLALNVGTVNTQALVAAGADVQAGGAMSVLSTSQATVTSVSDASAVVIPAGEDNQVQNSTTSSDTPPAKPDPSQTGVGVAIDLNVARVATHAIVQGGARLRAATLSVDAGTASDGAADHQFRAESISGAGVDKVGFAGALTINVVVNDSVARLSSDSTIELIATADPDLIATSQDLSVTSRNETTSTALSKSNVTGSPTTGVGPSIVVNISQNSSHADTSQAGFASNIDDLRVAANGNYTSQNIASAGSTAKATLQGEGGLAISPGLAVSVHDNSTIASAEENNLFDALAINGDLEIRTSHVSTTNSSSEALVNASGKAAIGTPVVVNVALDEATAVATGSFNVGGKADVLANSDIEVNGEATASVAGARAGSDGAATLKDRAQQWGNGFRREPGEPREKILERLEARMTEAGDKIEELTDGEAETIGVAASAVGNVVLSDTLAEVNGTINAAGNVRVLAESDRDVTANAFSLAVSPTFSDAIGAALALNVAVQTIEARAHSNNALSGSQITVRASGVGTDTHIVKTRAVAGGGGKENGRAGSIGINIVHDNVRASIGDSPVEDSVLTMSVTAPSGLTIESKSNLELQNIAGAAGVGFQTEGFGGALSLNAVNVTTEAITGEATTFNVGGSMRVIADSQIAPTKGDIFGDPIALAAGGAAAGDQARAGALTVNLISDTTRALIGADNNIQLTPRVIGRVTLPGNLDVAAHSVTELRTGAGAVALTQGLGQGVGIAANIINSIVEASIGTSSSVNAGGNIAVTADSSNDILSIAAAPTLGGSTGKPTFGGAIQVTSQVVKTLAEIDDNAVISSLGNTTVVANHTTEVDAIAGALSVNFNNDSVAGSLTITSLLDRTEARIGSEAQVNVSGEQGLTVQATSNENILPIAVGGSGAGGTASAGSATLNRIHETTLAHVDDNSIIVARNIVSPGTTKPSVRIHAQDDTVLNSASGVVSGGNKGLGGSLDATKIEKSTSAFVGAGVNIDADENLSITALSTEDVLSVAASIGASSQTSILGAMSGYSLDIQTRAILGDNPLDLLPPASPAIAHAKGSVVVTADNQTTQDFIGGGVGVSAGNAAGGAANIGLVKKLTEALIAPTSQVSADALLSVDAVAAANGKFNITFPNIGFESGRVQVPTFQSRDSDGDGLNDLADQSITRPRVVTPAMASQRGVIVTATNRDDLASFIAGGGGGAGGFSFGISTPAAILRTDTIASIGEAAQVNTSNQAVSGSTQSVLVAAASDYSHLGLSGALAVSSGAGIAPAANIESTRMNTLASIGENAEVIAKQDVVVQANATEDSLLITASGSLSGAGGGNGSVAVFAMDNQTHASIDAGADVDAGGNVVVSASDITDLDTIAGAAALGVGAGVSVSFGVNVIHKDTQAFIANQANVNAKAGSTNVIVFSDVAANSLTSTSTRGVIVQAYSSESLLDVAAAGAGSGGFAGAGSAGITVIDSDTSAFVGESASINTDSAGASALQSVHVIAANELDVRSITGGLAVGSAAFAGAADIGVIRSDTTSFIGANATVNAQNDIVVNSLAREEVDSLAVSGGFAITGSFAAAVAVWAIGTQFDPTYSDDATTANSLAKGNTTVDQQIAGSAGTSANVLSSALSNFSQVNNTTPVASPTPTHQIADILREGKQSLGTESLSSNEITTELFDSNSAGGTTAEVQSGASLTADDDIKINAKSNVDVVSNAGSVAAAAIAAVGAAINVERVHMKTDALFAGSIERADAVDIIATFNNSSSARSLSGLGAIGGALGAAVTSVRDDSSTTSRIDGSNGADASIKQASTVTVDANSLVTLNSRTGQGALAVGGAIGVTISRAKAEGATAALIGDHVQIGQTAGSSVGNLVVDAAADNHIEAHGTALVAGVGGAGNLNFSKAEIATTVDASLGNRTAASESNVTLSGSADIRAATTDMAFAEMRGLTLAGGAALGIGRATAIVAPDVEAAIGQDTHVVAGGAVNVSTQSSFGNYTDGSQVTPAGALSAAESAAGAAVAINSAQAFSETKPIVDANVYQNASISAGAVVVTANSQNRAESVGGSLTVGVLGVGGVETDAEIAGVTQAGLRTGSTITAQSLDVRSLSNDRAVAEGRAAAGGLLASGGILNPNATTSSARVVQGSRTAGSQSGGQFVVPVVLLQPNSSVNVNGATINVVGNVNLIADQEVDADAFAKGISIAAGRAAGRSQATVEVNPKLQALVQGATITAQGNVNINTNFGDGSNPSVTAMEIEESDALQNDEVSVAFAKGSGGALLGNIGSTASTIYKPIGDADVIRSVINASNVTISADADSSAAAVARNFSAGLVARGQANANLNMKNDLSATVEGSAEFQRSTIQAVNNVTVRVDSDQDGDAFSNTRAIAGFPTGTASTVITGDYDLSASVGSDVDIAAGGIIRIDSEVNEADFGSQRETDPTDPTNIFGRPNFIGANANSDTAGLSADAFATATTTIGTTNNPSQTVASLGAFSSLVAPQVFITADVNGIQLKADSSARSAGASVGVSSTATGEVHSRARVVLNSDSQIDATSVTLESLNGSSSNGIQAEVESTTDKDGIAGSPQAQGTIRMDTASTISANNRSKIAIRNLTVRADTNVSQFDLTVLENDTPRADSGVRISSFVRDRSINWNADVVLKGAASPTLVVDSVDTVGANVSKAVGVTIQDTDGDIFNTGTLGNVAAPTIVVNAINNTAAYGDILFEIPRRGTAAADTGVINGNLGSFTVQRGFDEVNILNHSNKPLVVNAINVFNMSTPEIVVDAPNSGALAFPVFHDFGDTHINIENDNKSGQPSITLNGIINNPVGETTVDSSNAILRTGAGKIISNVADLRSRGGSIGSSASRLPVDIVVSNGRQEDLNVNSSNALSLDLTAHQRQAGNGQLFTIDTTEVVAVNANSIRVNTSVQETILPDILPLLQVDEIQENDVTQVVSFFETTEEIISLDLGAVATNPIPIDSHWNFGAVKGSSIAIDLNPAQIGGPLVDLSANTDVGSSSINVSTNGHINMTETVGTMRIGAITTTRGNVTLNSNNSITVSPTDSAADVEGTVVALTAATTIGSTTAPIDVNSTSQLNASAGGNIVLVETAGNANIGLVAASNGDVSVTALAGSILDGASDAAADIVGNSVTLNATNTTNTVAPTVGTLSNALEINSSATTSGSVRAVARGDVFLSETLGSLTLAEVRSSTGSIRVDVPDTSGTGSNLALINAQVIAPNGAVQLNAGDNFSSDTGSVVQGTVIGVVTDFGNADPGTGSITNVSGSFSGRPVTFSSGNDADTIVLQQTGLQGRSVVNAGGGNDSILVDSIAPLTSTTSGVRDALTLNLGSGDNQVAVVTTASGNYIANVVGDQTTSFNTLNVNGTTGNDSILLNRSQLSAIHSGSPTTTELISFGDSIDRVSIFANSGNDALSVDLAAGNLGFSAGVSFDGGSGSDSMLVSGSNSADVFEVDASGADSGSVRTQVNGGAFAQPIVLSAVEQLSFNGLNPTSNPGDTLRVLDSVSILPTVPSGSLVTPLPVVYTNIEQVQIGSQPLANDDRITGLEDLTASVNPFANDSGLSDLPVTVVLVQPTVGTVVYRDNGTPSNLSDDSLVYTPPANFSGTTEFQYTVSDANGDRSTARVTVVIDPVTDAPIVSAEDVSGPEGVPIQLLITAELVDRDASESLALFLHNVPTIASFVNDANQTVGLNLGNGNWQFTPSELRSLFIVIKDNGQFALTIEAIASEARGRDSVSRLATFAVNVGNTAPQTTIMEAPESTIKDEEIAVRMAATDASAIDQASGFTYRVDWGDGSEVEVVRGEPGIGPTLKHTYRSSGIFTIEVTATDKDGGEGSTARHQIRVSFSGLINDPLDPAKKMLFVDGTAGNDDISIQLRGKGRNAMLDVYRNELLEASYTMPDSRIVISGYDGHDSLFVSSDVSIDSWLFGGQGNDLLYGSSGNSILVGGDGSDLMRGRGGDDILIGGRDSDLLFGEKGNNILLAGYSLHDAHESALLDIQREWTSNGSVAHRIAHLTGKSSGGDNGTSYLRGQGPAATAFDDRAVDLIYNEKSKDWVLGNSDHNFVDDYDPSKYFEELDVASGGAAASTADDADVLELVDDSRPQLSQLEVNGEQFFIDLSDLPEQRRTKRAER